MHREPSKRFIGTVKNAKHPIDMKCNEQRHRFILCMTPMLDKVVACQTLPNSAEYVANIDPKRPTPHRPPLQPPQKAEAGPRPPATAESKREVETQRASLRRFGRRRRSGRRRNAARRRPMRIGQRCGRGRNAARRRTFRCGRRCRRRSWRRFGRRKPRPPSRLTLAANPCG